MTMAEGEPYIREQDREEYGRFCMHHIPNFARALPDEIWHYTTADGLIGILKSGQIWSTQVACLNDTLEPIQEVLSHGQGAGLVKRRSMMRIIARRMNAAPERA